ncbi:alpha/beta hydrolase [Fructilactobacillus vespulae]|uniref:alpha/beta hydrolase n=1 Tax=Fructilactobacillus vespulae TaxID=1249630 RepID=UPI0039B50CE4
MAVIIVAGIGMYYLFNFAFQRGGFSTTLGGHPNTEWYDTTQSQTWTQKTKDNITLKAHYFEAEQPTNKTVIVIHGYGGSARKMSSYEQMFHNMGYNVLAPDNRSFGDSGGNYTGYGWKDRTDIVNWMKQINQYNPHTEIGMYGISMGAAAVMFTLPEAPQNVKFAIADCGYTSINAELTHELKTMFNLPAFPIIPLANIYSQVLAGYGFDDANTKNTLKHNEIPLFIIHGSKDNFVPTKFAYENYKNNKGNNKELWIVKNAKHAQSRLEDPQEYQRRVGDFAMRWFE